MTLVLSGYEPFYGYYIGGSKPRIAKLGENHNISIIFCFQYKNKNGLGCQSNWKLSTIQTTAITSFYFIIAISLYPIQILHLI